MRKAAKWTGLMVAVLFLIGAATASAFNGYSLLKLGAQGAVVEDELREIRNEVRQIRAELGKMKQAENARLAETTARMAATQAALAQLQAELRTNTQEKDREIYKSSYRSVVRIRVFGNTGGLSQGSGFVVKTSRGDREEKVIVTTHHLLSENPSEIRVTGFDGLEWRAAVDSTSPEKDLAVLATVGPLPYKALEFAAPESAAPGDPILFIGHPNGFEWSLISGVISAIAERNDVSAFCRECQVIQTDAAIGPGYSGSPGFNREGRVVGIVFSKASQNGISFAIPAVEAQRLLNGANEK